MPSAQNAYRDRLFSYIFGSEENKAWTLELYNAVNGSDYKDPSRIQINTIKEVLYMGMHNDVSFLITEEMNLYEQQSTFCPNLPVRLLQYLGNLYEKYMVKNNLNKYGRRLIMLPVPKLVVFYNGRDEMEDETMLHLSDSFPEGSTADIEVTVRMLNINYGKNKKLLDACEPLKEYSWLMKRIRTYIDEGLETIDAINKAIRETPEDYVLKPFLVAHKTEVSGLLLTEYDEAKTMELFRLDGVEEGRKEGRKEGVDQMATLMKDLLEQGRIEDAQKAAVDEEARKLLFVEFGLI